MSPELLWPLAIGLPLGLAAGYFIRMLQVPSVSTSASKEQIDKQARLQAENELLAKQVNGLRETESLLRLELSDVSLNNARLETQLDEREQALTRISGEHQERLAELARRQQEDLARQKEAEERQKEHAREQAELQKAQFQALSRQTLETLKTELEEKSAKEYALRQTALDERLGNILKPLKDVLDKNEQKVLEVEKQHLESTTTLKTQIGLLVEQTQSMAQAERSLVDALKNSKGRGDWGEMELIRLLEHSGLLEGVHYEAQRQENGLRPDITLRMSNKRVLYIDAKTILVNLERMIQAEEDSDEGQLERKKHAAALEKEIMSLSLKAYESQTGESIDFVVLYVPRESMLRAALEERPALMETAFQKRVLLASPLVLMSLLKTVAYGWEQAQLSQKAQEIYDLGRELHKRAATFVNRFEDVGKRLNALTSSYEDAQKSLRGRQGMLPQLRKFEGYGVKSDKRLPDISVLEEIEQEKSELEQEELLLLQASKQIRPDAAGISTRLDAELLASSGDDEVSPEPKLQAEEEGLPSPSSNSQHRTSSRLSSSAKVKKVKQTQTFEAPLFRNLLVET